MHVESATWRSASVGKRGGSAYKITSRASLSSELEVDTTLFLHRPTLHDRIPEQATSDNVRNQEGTSNPPHSLVRPVADIAHT